MIELQEVSIALGSFSLQNISFRIEAGKYAVLMGRTGCGKTTILESICGLRRIQGGKVIIDETDVSRWSPADRNIGYVPQDLALFPTMTVREHLEFAARIRKQPKKLIAERTTELSQILGIDKLLARNVVGLSGGEAQRVALGRALAFKPSVLLLDEPLSALDEATRHEMHALLRKIRDTSDVTTLHITHHRDDSNALADCCLEFDESGMITQVA